MQNVAFKKFQEAIQGTVIDDTSHRQACRRRQEPHLSGGTMKEDQQQFINFNGIFFR
jgi:hypothetical protein